MQIFPVFTPNLGCPHKCLFCDQQRSTAVEGDSHPGQLGTVLDSVLPAQGVGEIAFYGGTFTLLPTETLDAYLDMAAAFRRAGRIRGVRISTRPDALDSKMVDKLVAAGVLTVEIGCQSFSNEVLNRAGRGHSAEDCRDAVLRCRSAGLRVGLQLMPGLPDACPDEAVNSLKSALQLNPDFLRIYPTVVLKGTALARLWQNGRYQAWSLAHAVDVCSKMLLLARQADVPVVRMGLQHNPVLQDNLLDGPHHPAFGQLVKSRLWRSALTRLLPNTRDICINPRDFSDVTGHYADNRVWMAENFPGSSLSTEPSVPVGYVRGGQRLWSLESLAGEICDV